MTNEEILEEFYQHMLKSTPVLNEFERASLKLKVKVLLTSRDTYWKERVRKEVDQILSDVLEEHFPVERFLKSRAPAMRYMHHVQARFHDSLQALDKFNK